MTKKDSMQEHKPQSSLLTTLRTRFFAPSLGLAETHLGELLRGSSVAFILRVLGIVAGYFFTLIVTRTFGAYAMGVFAITITVLNVVVMLGKAGLDTALLKFVAEYSSQGRIALVRDIYFKSMSIVVPLCLFLSVALFLFSSYIAEHIFSKGYMASYFRIASFAILPAALLGLNSHYLRGLKKIAAFAFIQHVAVFLVAALVLFSLLLFSREAQVPVVAFVLSLVLVSGLSFFMCKRSGLPGDNIKHERMRLSSVLGVSIPMFFASSTYFIMQWTDILMLGIFRPEGDVGIYNVAVKVAGVTSITLLAINSIVAPKFAESYGKGDMVGLRDIVGHSTKLIFWTSFPILLVLFIFPSFILGIFGTEFRGGVFALLLLTVGQFVNAVSGPVGFLLNMTDRQNVVLGIMLAASTINITLNAVLIPVYGITGAAMASMASMAFWNLAAVAYIKARFNILTLYIPGLRWSLK